VAIAVVDTGRGISSEFLPHVFERFRQAETSSDRRHGGLGLGLAIASQLTQLHGGTIRAESEGPGRGARFVVRLPALPPQAEASRREPRPDYVLRR
jgi:signal transduction histidine kinase